MGPILTALLAALPVIFDLLERCDADSDDGALQDRIRNPGPFALLRMGREYRRMMGWSRAEWRRNRARTLAELRHECSQLTDDDCAALVEEWRADRQA